MSFKILSFSFCQIFFFVSIAIAQDSSVTKNSFEDWRYHSQSSEGRTGYYTLGNLDNNFWDNGTAGVSPTASGVFSSAITFKNITYPTPVSSNTALNNGSGIVCSAEDIGASNKIGKQNPQQALDTNLDCTSLYGLGINRFHQERWQESYDALKQYIEQCALESGSNSAFGTLTNDNQERSTDLNRYPEHREWLKKVLYYNPDTLYYCEDVYSILQTFMFFDSTHGLYREAAMAVIQYILDSAKCGYLRVTYLQDLSEDSALLYKEWLDTVKDTSKTPFNIVIPTIDDLGLSVLRGTQNSVIASTDIRIGKLQANPNPFRDELDLSYLLEKNAMVRIDIYDISGKAVYSGGQGFKQAGQCSLTISTRGWPSGSYYVRLSTPSGEVKTVKVIKE